MSNPGSPQYPRAKVLPDRYIPIYGDFQRYISGQSWAKLPIWVKEALLMGKAQMGELYGICLRRNIKGTLGTGDGWQYSTEGSHFWLDGQKVGPSIILTKDADEKTIETVRDLQGDIIYEAEWNRYALQKVKVPSAGTMSRKGSRIARILHESYEIYVPLAESG